MTNGRGCPRTTRGSGWKHRSTRSSDAALFAEAAAAAVSPHFASIDDHIDPELDTILPTPMPYANQVANNGNPVDLLINVAVHIRVIDRQQHASYRARHSGIDRSTHDALDQALMMGMGYAIRIDAVAKVFLVPVTPLVHVLRLAPSAQRISVHST